MSGNVSFRVIALLSICGAVSLHAQLTRGFISGTIQDVTGAVMEGVSITITNLDTGIERETVTNGAGVYRIAAVEPGRYQIEFRRSGFETKRVGPIVVSTTQEVVVNQTLTVASVSTAVEVQAAPQGAELEKASGTIDRKLDSQLTEVIPTTALRDITRLVLLAPLTTRATGQNNFSVNGQRGRNTNFVVDGVDNNDVAVTIPVVKIIPEQVAEFHVQSAAYSAEFGHSTGGQVEETTKSGTNHFHGGVYDYYSANWMEPLSLPQKRSGVRVRPRYVENEAGGQIGGPVIRNRTFFYGLVETNRRREAPNADNASTVTVPTPAGFALLQTLPLGPSQTTASRQAALDAMKFFPSIYPALHFSSFNSTNINGVQIPLGSGRIPLANPFDFWNIAARVDHQLTVRDNLTYRLLYDKRHQPDVVSNLGFGERFAGAQAILGQNHSVSETHVFSPRLVNEFRASYARRNLAFPENDPRTSTAIITSQFTIGGASNFPQGRVQNVFQYQDIATYTVGRHSLKTGLDFRRIRLFDLNGFNTKGTWTFDTLGDFLNNRASQLTQAVKTASVDYRVNQIYPFFQDDFKATKNLTLNLGLRWEYTSFPLGLLGAREPETLAVGVPGPVSAPKNNWAPRFGFAYSPTGTRGLAHTLFGDGRTVIRGGFGMFYDVVFFNLLSISETQYPRIVNDNRFFPETANLYPTLLPVTATKPVLNPLNAFFNAVPGFRNPASENYSLSVQREFRRSYVLEIGYSGNHAYRQISQGELNPAVLTPAQANAVIQAGSISAIPGTQARRVNPAWGARSTYESAGNSRYNAGFVRLDKKMAHNLVLGTHYSFSRLLSDNDESLAVTNLADSSPPVPQDYRNRRPEWGLSAFDRKHRFVVYYDYTTPWFSGGNRVLRTAFKDWEIAGSSEWQSGQPFTIRTGVDSVGNGRTDSARPFYNPAGAFTPDVVTGDLRTFSSPLTGGRFVTSLSPAGLPLPASEPFGGNLGRNTYRGPSLTQWNLSFSKRVPITERLGIQFRADMFNLFNHRNFGNPENRLVSPLFGQNTRDQIATFGRSMLMSAHVQF